MPKYGLFVNIQLQMQARRHSLDVVVQAEGLHIIVARPVKDGKKQGIEDVCVVTVVYLFLLRA